MFKLTCIPNWHSIDISTTRLSVFAVSTDTYQARWTDTDPEKIYISGWEEAAPDFVELRVGAYLECTDDSHMPDPSTFSADLMHDQKLIEKIDHALKKEDTAQVHFSASSYAGGKYHYTVIFAYDHVRLDVRYEFTGKLTLQKATYCALSRERASVFDADTLFNPNPTSHGKQHTSLSVKAISGSNSERWFSPAPFCFPMRLRNGTWMSVSPAPTIEQLEFTGFSNTPCALNECAFSLDYTCLPEYENELHLPEFVFRFNAESEYAALQDYANGLVALNKIERLERTKADWWKGVMVCGWFAQNGSDGCTQELYEKHVATYEEVGVDWDILTIDDFWGKEHGIWRVNTETWPDMRGFIDRQHAAGKKVLLWVCVNPTGLPDDELYITETKKMLDPCNPKYRARVFEAFRYMFSSENGCLDADGIKLDFTGYLPHGNNPICTHKLIGMRYLYELYKLFHEAAKTAKPDCLLDYQVANPHFAAFHDMTRLNDYFLPVDIAVTVMKTRAKIAHSVTFGAEVDTDHPDSIEYYENSHAFGNMSLYISNKQILKNPDRIAAIRYVISKYIKPHSK